MRIYIPATALLAAVLAPDARPAEPRPIAPVPRAVAERVIKAGPISLVTDRDETVDEFLQRRRVTAGSFEVETNDWSPKATGLKDVLTGGKDGYIIHLHYPTRNDGPEPGLYMGAYPIVPVRPAVRRLLEGVKLDRYNYGLILARDAADGPWSVVGVYRYVRHSGWLHFDREEMRFKGAPASDTDPRP